MPTMQANHTSDVLTLYWVWGQWRRKIGENTVEFPRCCKHGGWWSSGVGANMPNMFDQVPLENSGL